MSSTSAEIRKLTDQIRKLREEILRSGDPAEQARLQLIIDIRYKALKELGG